MEVNADLMSAAGVLFPWDTNMYGSLMASFCWLRFWKNNSSRGRSSVRYTNTSAASSLRRNLEIAPSSPESLRPF